MARTVVDVRRRRIWIVAAAAFGAAAATIGILVAGTSDPSPGVADPTVLSVDHGSPSGDSLSLVVKGVPWTFLTLNLCVSSGRSASVRGVDTVAASGIRIVGWATRRFDIRHGVSYRPGQNPLVHRGAADDLVGFDSVVVGTACTASSTDAYTQFAVAVVRTGGGVGRTRGLSVDYGGATDLFVPYEIAVCPRKCPPPLGAVAPTPASSTNA